MTTSLCPECRTTPIPATIVGVFDLEHAGWRPVTFNLYGHDNRIVGQRRSYVCPACYTKLQSEALHAGSTRRA